jgi:hypothetical protein
LLAAVPILNYAFPVGGSEVEQAYDMTRDANGNIYVVGDFYGTVDFDPGATHGGDTDILTPAAGQDAFVAKYTAAGALVWAKPLGMSNGTATFNGVAVDASGNVFACGYFDGGDGEAISSIGPFDGVLAKFDMNGNREWALGFGSLGEFTGVNEVATDSAGHIYIGGFLQGPVDFDPGLNETVLSPTGSETGFIARFNPAGSLSWAHNTYGDVGDGRVNQLAIDTEDSIVATGQSSSGGFLLKLDDLVGATTWVKAINSGQTDGIAIDAENNIVASGIFQGATDFDPGPSEQILAPAGSGPHSGFIWKLDSAGNYLWAQRPEGGIISTAYKVAVDSSKNVYAVGNFFGRTDMDPGLGTFYLEEPGGGDYTWKLDGTSGEFVWARSTNADENYAGLVVDGSGDVYLAPTFSDSIYLDPSPQSVLLESHGESDFALIKLSQGVVIDQVNLDQAFSVGSSAQEVALDMTQDADGNTYVVGTVNDDAFLAKYTPAGTQAWFQSLSGIADVSAYTTVSVDALGNVFAGGFARGGDTLSYSHPGDHGLVLRYSTDNPNLNVQEGHIFPNALAINEVVADGEGGFYVAGDIIATPGDPLSCYVAHVNPLADTPIWEHEFTSPMGVSASDLVIDGAADLLVSGTFEGTVDFNPGAPGGEATSSPPNTSSGFLLKLTGAGGFSWLTAVNESNELRGIAVDSQDQIYVAGSASSGFNSGFIWKLNDGGGPIWDRNVASNPDRLAVDSNGAVYAVTRINGRTDMDPAPGTTFYLDAGEADALLKLDENGDFVWVRSFDNDTVANHAGILVDNNSNIYLAPTFTGSVDFDLGPQGHVLTSQGGSDFAVVKYSQQVVLTVDPDTITTDLQQVITELQDGNTAATTIDVTLTATADQMSAVVTAINDLDPVEEGPTTNIVVSAEVEGINAQDVVNLINTVAPDTSGLHLEVVLTVSGDVGGLSVSLQEGVKLILQGTDTTRVVGASPALTIQSGEVIISGITFQNATDAPTILVTGGSLVLRDSVVEESTGGSQASFLITGGTVDLGTAGQPGGNTINVIGPGELVRNLSASPVAALGNEFQADGSTITDNALMEELIFHGLDNAIYGVVNFGGTTLFVGAGGNLAGAVDAAPEDATIFVAPGAPGDYDAGSKLITIYFENGPTVSQLPDATNPNLRTLTVVGTPGNDVISFDAGSDSGLVMAAVSGVPTGRFMPTGRLIAYGEDGNDQISVDEAIALTAILDGGEGNDEIFGGAGDDLLLGGGGSDRLTGAAGNDFLAGGQGTDRIVGSAGHDVLVAGDVASHFTHNDLLLIAQQWAANRTVDNSTADDELDEAFGGLDSLTGSSGADWFIVSVNDKVTDFKKNNKDGDVLTLV